MRIFKFSSRFLPQICPIMMALGLGVSPALAGSRSAMMDVSAMVVSSCTVALDQSTRTPRVRTACTRGEQARVSRVPAPSLVPPPPELAVTHGRDGATFLVVTY